VLLCLYREHLVALHGFVKKARTTPEEDLALARKRKKDRAMSKKHMGSSIDDFLREEGIFEEAQTQAVKEVVAWQLAEAMRMWVLSDLGTLAGPPRAAPCRREWQARRPHTRTKRGARRFPPEDEVRC